MMLVHQDQRFSSNFIRMGARFCFIPAFLISRPRIHTRTMLVFDEQTDIPELVLFPIQVPIELSRIVFPTINPASGCPYRFRSRGTAGSLMVDQDFGHLCRGRRIQLSGHSDFGIFNKDGASSELPECTRILRHLLVRRNLVVLQ